MLDSIVQMLDQVGSTVFWTCALALAVIDIGAIALVVRTRSRTLVNRWTGTVLTANALLLGAGLGVPATTFVVKVAVRAVTASVQDATARSIPAQPEARTPR